MNLVGQEFIKKTREEYSALPPEWKRHFDWSDITERAMRCGYEAALYKPLFHWPDDTVEMDDIALASLQDDCIKRYQSSLPQPKKSSIWSLFQKILTKIISWFN